MYRKKRYAKRKRYVTKKKAYGGRSSVVSKNVKRYVNRVLNRRIEDKQVGAAQVQNFGGILESTDFNAFPILPYTGYLIIPQGVTQGTRTGNECKVKKVMLNYTLTPLPYNAVTNPTPLPFHVQLMLGCVKATKGVLPVAGDINQMFNLGGTVLAPGGSLMDLNYTINDDYWDIKKVWAHKIGYAESAGTGSLAGNQFFSNNDFKLNVVKRMDITKLCASTLKFNDASTTHQGNNLFFMFQCLPATGSSYSNVIQACQIQFFITIDYEDA